MTFRARTRLKYFLKNVLAFKGVLLAFKGDLLAFKGDLLALSTQHLTVRDNLPGFTWIYMDLHGFTWIYMDLHVSIN